MTDRLEFIDAIKGFAITLMVMGHVIAWMFVDWSVLIPTSSSPALLWNLIYSFHMPLFMFVSGYLFGRKQICDFGAYFKYVGRKSLPLLIPYFVMGIVAHYYYAFAYGKSYHWFAYWYLLTLFQLIAVVGLILLCSARIRNRMVKLAVDIVLLLVAYRSILWLQFCMPAICSYVPKFAYLGVDHIQGMFWPFAIGMLFTKYNINIPKWIDSIKGVWCCFLLWAFSFSFNLSEICKWSGVFAAFIAFRNISWLRHNAVTYIGRISLSIYILHLFFRYPFLAAGKWFVEVSLEYGLTGRILTLPVQLVLSLAISLVIIIACAVLDRQIQKVPIVRTLVLGACGARRKFVS